MEEYKYAFENYEVSNFGNVRRKLNNSNYKVIEGSIQNRGYRYFQLQRNGKRINYLIHHLVAQAFLGDRSENLVIDHIDRNKLNNNASNLRYVTQKDNMINTDKYIVEIEETDPIKRHSLVKKRWVDKNRDEYLKKKKVYYEANKERLIGNRDEYLKKKKAYYEANKERLWKDENGKWKK